MRGVTTIVLCFLLSNFVFCKLDTSTSQLVKDYFSYRNVRVIRIFTCSLYDKVALAKSLQTYTQFWMPLSDPEIFKFQVEDLYDWERSTLTADYYRFGLFLDYDCLKNQQIFKEASDKRYLNSRHLWLIWSVDSYEKIGNARLNVDSEVTWATPEGTSNSVLLYDIYKINFTWPLSVIPAGSWHPDTGLNYTLTTYKYIRRENLQQLLFDTAIACFNPSIKVDDIHEHLLSHEEKNFTTIMTKCSYAQTLMLKKKFNFTTKLYQTESSNFAPFDDGYFQGQIGMLQRKEATFTPCPLLIFRKRERAIDFVAPTWYFDVAAMFRHPQVRGMKIALLEPFSVAVWLCTLVSWVLGTVALKLTSSIESFYDKENAIDSSWDTMTLTTVGAITEQGWEMESKSVSCRTVFLFMLIQVVLLNNYYGGGVVSSLLAAPTKTIRTLKELINSNLQVGYEDVNYNRGYFQQSNDPLVHELYRKKIHPPKQARPNAYPIDIGVKKMKDEPFVLHGEQLGAYPFIEATFTDSEKCALTEIRIFSSMVGPVYVMVQKGSPYKEIFTYGYRQIWERGLMHYKLLEWQPQKPRCLVKNDIVSVEIQSVSFAYYILAFGVLASISIVIMENLCYKRSCIMGFALKRKPRRHIDRDFPARSIAWNPAIVTPSRKLQTEEKQIHTKDFINQEVFYAE